MDYVLEYYEDGMFTDEDMKLFIQVGWITYEQYNATRAKMGLDHVVVPK